MMKLKALPIMYQKERLTRDTLSAAKLRGRSIITNKGDFADCGHLVCLP